jgi:hypothetical protein
MFGQSDWHLIKIMYYEKDHHRHFMHGILCKLRTASSWSTTSSSGSTCASSGSVSCEGN